MVSTRHHSILYDSRMAAFKETAKKDKLWQDKAAEMGVDPERLKTWVKTQRDKLGRILAPLKKHSGSAATIMSDTERWVMANCDGDSAQTQDPIDSENFPHSNS